MKNPISTEHVPFSITALASTIPLFSHSASPTDLGIESNEIPDNQITASSFVDHKHLSSFGRLNYPFKAHAWCADHKDANQWLKFDLGYTMLVTGVVTQSKGDGNAQWVTTYKVGKGQPHRVLTYKVGNVKSVFKAHSNTDGRKFVVVIFSRLKSSRQMLFFK